MASGDKYGPEHRHLAQYLLIDAVSATSDGVWIDTADFPDGSIEVTIATTATVQIRGSEAATQPAAATSGNQLGSDITATATFDLTNAPKWIKAKISSWGSGAVTVKVTLRRKVAS